MVRKSCKKGFRRIKGKCRRKPTKAILTWRAIGPPGQSNVFRYTFSSITEAKKAKRKWFKKGTKGVKIIKK